MLATAQIGKHLCGMGAAHPKVQLETCLPHTFNLFSSFLWIKVVQRKQLIHVHVDLHMRSPPLYCPLEQTKLTWSARVDPPQLM